MTRSDVILAQETHRRMLAVSEPAVDRDCAECGATMSQPRPQTLVTRQTTVTMRHLYRCAACQSWESHVAETA